MSHQQMMASSSHSYDDRPPHQRLCDARVSRRQAESDRQLMENRLLRLQIEEEKARKKIEETKRRATEIFVLKMRNEEVRQQKLQQKQQQELDRQLEMQRIAVKRAEHAQVLQHNRAAIMGARKEEADQTKVYKMENKRMLGHFKNQEQERVARQAALVREQQRKAQTRKIKDKMLHEVVINHEYENRVLEEELARNEVEDTISRMENQERMLIERLKIAQQLQYSAYEELENALLADGESLATMSPKSTLSSVKQNKRNSRGRSGASTART